MVSAAMPAPCLPRRLARVGTRQAPREGSEEKEGRQQVLVSLTVSAGLATRLRLALAALGRSRGALL